jgi:hypothetical protein
MIALRLTKATMIFLALLCSQAHAVVVENLHRALVDVEDHSNRELQRATREGLAQVLIKVSGSATVLQMDDVRVELDQAQRFMQRYRYLRPNDEDLKLQVHFDPQLVNDVLRDAQAPLWTANRPPVLIWLVLSDNSGRRPATAENNPELFEQLQLELDRRGVPAVFPLNDLQDTMAVSVQDLWRLDEAAIRVASERYGVSNILAGRLRAMDGNRWQGDWTFLFDRDSSTASFYGEEAPVFTADAVDFVADRLARRYAVAGEGGALEVLVRVDALAEFADLRRVQKYFESIELIDDAWPAYLEGDSVVFRLAAQADAQQLDRIVQLNRRLERLDAAEPLRRGPINLDLVYRWNP